jgi:hypothetical protein
LVAVVLAAAACAFVSARVDADPIIPNAHFSLGNSGFTSGYTYLAPAVPDPRMMWPERTYTVAADPAQYHSRWPSFGDHTTGDGGMMIVNGSPEAGITVWSTTVEVDRYTQYDFTAWAASVFTLSPSSLEFSVNGLLLGQPFTLSPATGLWERYSAGWYSGTDTVAVLSLVDRNLVRYGNDFALDDIELAVRPPLDDPDEPPAPVPDPGSTLLLLSGGLAGLAGLAGLVTRSKVTKAS